MSTLSDVNFAITNYTNAVDKAASSNQEFFMAEEAFKAAADGSDPDAYDVAYQHLMVATISDIGCQYKLAKQLRLLDVTVKLFEILNG